jgi:uncharacterized protein YceH (UPF0502 family)
VCCTLPGAAVALLAVLMLRGPQTSAELRLNSERLHRFADISSVEGFLEELAAKPEPDGGEAGTRARRARSPLGAPAVRRSGAACGRANGASGDDEWRDIAGELAAIKAEQTRLAGELAELKALVQRLARRAGHLNRT